MRGIKNRGNNKWKRLGVFLILLLVFGVLLNSIKNVYQKKKLAQETLGRMEKELAEFKDREKFLKESFVRMTTKEGIEFEMRKKLNVAQAGESVAVIVEEAPKTPAPNYLISPWQKIKNFFVGLFK